MKLRVKNSSIDGYILLLRGYARSPFREFESCIRIVVDLDEDDNQMISKQYNSIFSPMIYHQAFTQLKIIQREFTLGVIMKEPYKLNITILA